VGQVKIWSVSYSYKGSSSYVEKEKKKLKVEMLCSLSSFSLLGGKV
jgi:hypothetical protein